MDSNIILNQQPAMFSWSVSNRPDILMAMDQEPKPGNNFKRKRH